MRIGHQVIGIIAGTDNAFKLAKKYGVKLVWVTDFLFMAAQNAGRNADVLLVDGDPIAHLDVIGDPARNFRVIMKDGKVFKNLLP